MHCPDFTKDLTIKDKMQPKQDLQSKSKKKTIGY